MVIFDYSDQGFFIFFFPVRKFRFYSGFGAGWRLLLGSFCLGRFINDIVGITVMSFYGDFVDLLDFGSIAFCLFLLSLFRRI